MRPNGSPAVLEGRRRGIWPNDAPGNPAKAFIVLTSARHLGQSGSGRASIGMRPHRYREGRQQAILAGQP